MQNKTVRLVLFLLVGLFLTVISFSVEASVSPEDFVNRLKLKFRRTASIYLTAQSSQLPESSDTTTITLAYNYPDQFLQWVKGTSGREQILIMNGDDVVLSYPHLDMVDRRNLTEEQRMQILVNEVPLAAMMLGVQSDSVPLENIKTELQNGRLQAEITNKNPNIPYRRGEAIFDWPHLHPVYFIIESEKSFAVQITSYQEEERFPIHIERAIYNMEPELLKGEQP